MVAFAIFLPHLLAIFLTILATNTVLPGAWPLPSGANAVGLWAATLPASAAYVWVAGGALRELRDLREWQRRRESN